MSSEEQAGKRTRLIEIKLPGCVLFLKEDEVTRLLQLDLMLYEEAVRRGKGILRRRQAQARQSKAPARCREPSAPW